MSPFLTTDRSGAIPIMAVRKDSLPAWLEQHPRSREWLSRIGFKAEPGTFAFLPDARRPRGVDHRFTRDGRAGVRICWIADRIARRANTFFKWKSRVVSPADAALGWALGVLCVYCLHDAKARAGDARLARRRRSARSRAHCAQRVSGARHDQHARGRHGTRTSRRRRQQGREMRMARSSTSSSVTTCCGKTIRRSTSSAARARGRRASSISAGEMNRRPRSRWSARACASIRAVSTSRRTTGCCR